MEKQDSKIIPKGNYLIEIDVQDGMVDKRIVIGTEIRIISLAEENLSVILGASKKEEVEENQNG